MAYKHTLARESHAPEHIDVLYAFNKSELREHNSQIPNDIDLGLTIPQRADATPPRSRNATTPSMIVDVCRSRRSPAESSSNIFVKYMHKHMPTEL